MAHRTARVRFGEFAPNLLPSGEELLGPLEQQLTHASENQAPAALFEDGQTQVLGQGSQLVGHGRWSVSETVCGLGEGADLGEDSENLETLINHAILLHDRVEKDSLFFAGLPADTGLKQ